MTQFVIDALLALASPENWRKAKALYDMWCNEPTLTEAEARARFAAIEADIAADEKIEDDGWPHA